ncbi:mucin-12 [Clinocottus analis]|uniref:mucin-12 n=1 Tax=Clinocottus analis TaxID=304258 RepID=UPI0035BFA010
MEKYYLAKKIENFKEIVVISVSRGEPIARFLKNTVDEIQLWDEAIAIYSITTRADSVSVTHDVVLAILNNASAEQQYEENVEAIQEAVGSLVSCTEDCPNFNITAPPRLNTTEADLELVCEQFVNNTDIAKYYQPVPIDGMITCLTVCHSRHSHHKRCYNKGICTVYKATGPLCQCHNIDATWYLYDDCSLPIHRTAFYAGLSVTLACLLLTMGVLTAFLLRNKQRQKRKRDIKEQLVNQWLDEDFEWQRSSTDSHNPGDSNNLAYTHEESASDSGDRTVYRQPATGPSMDTDDRELGSAASIYSLESDTPYRPDSLTYNTM